MVRFKIYYDKDEEEVWLKQMVAQGWALRKFFMGFYTFEPCTPGEYHYQIDLLDNWNGDKAAYTAFMQDLGVEVIAQWWRWVYLRKKAADGPFEMYTDVESKITLYRKIKQFFQVALVIELSSLVVELAAALRTGSVLFGGFTILLGLISAAMLKVIWKCQWRIEQLEQGKTG